MWTAKTLIRLGGSEPSLGVQVSLLVFSFGSSFACVAFLVSLSIITHGLLSDYE